MNLFEYTYNLVRQIPEGKISSYGAVAKALGDVVASRAVGRMMNQNPDADDMPCYKIVHSDGRLGGFGLGMEDKIRRLREVNIKAKDGKIVDFDNVFFNDFKTDYPLKKLKQQQLELSKKVQINDDFAEIKNVAGIDVAYPKDEFEDACGACVIMDYKTKQILEENIVFVPTYFPYILTYFSYREFPIMKELIKNLDLEPSIFLIDGNGILHPRSFGLASHFGVFSNYPSIGVAKRLLYGTVEKNVVTIDKNKRGYALIQSQRTINPIYVSPGHRISFDRSLEIVKHLSKYKIPEPLRLAHTLAKKHLLKGR